MENQSSVSEFLLLGLPIRPEQQSLFFALFLGIYLTTVLGNLLIMLLIKLDSHLHTPMYFFLSHLAFNDVCLSSVTVPKMLTNMHTNDKSISFAACISQTYFLIWFGCFDNFLLAVMAYDRYVAICQPLHYTTIMRQELCVLLVAACWFFSNLHSLLHTLLLAGVSFCADNTIHHFFCDLTTLLKMSCSDISINELVIFYEGVVIVLSPFGGIVGSYIRIWTTVLREPSAKKFFKVLSTCGSHLLVVSLYCGTIAEVYLFSSSDPSSDEKVTASLMYMVVTPLLNPFIYSLRNRDMKRALETLVNRQRHEKHEMKNQSGESEFLLLGLPIRPEQRGLFFALFLGMYLTTMLTNMHTNDKSISFAACISQTYFLILFGCFDNFLLAVMAYDRMSCSDISINELVIFYEGGVIVLSPFGGVVGSYIRIWTTVLREPSAKKFFKVLSTCGSHLLVVSLFYGTISEVYLFSSSSTSSDENITASVMYMVVTPLLNPFIYSLRNRDMKRALETLVNRVKFLTSKDSR
ncbi:olfactory receptor 1J4-like [Talpa occidentalis]|uniref:olfactory receptor 1J4-like n=1 Tax=Talpa occidentalis TaxID=50954 RepID=UPI0023F68122|nr:olfactory receptor 1J4-like [Talpa occidentalis]